jgi:hypothetical protein
MEADLDLDKLIVVRLNCGEPVSVTVNHRTLRDITVVFLEASEMAEEIEGSTLLDNDQVVAKVGRSRYEDMNELLEQLEDAGIF